MKTAIKLDAIITRTRMLSTGEKRPSRRAKIKKMATKPVKPTPSSAIRESCSVALDTYLAAFRIGRSAAPHRPPTVAEAPKWNAKYYHGLITAILVNSAPAWYARNVEQETLVRSDGAGVSSGGGWITFAREFFDKVAKISVYHRAVLGKTALHGGARENMPHTVDLSFPNLDR